MKTTLFLSALAAALLCGTPARASTAFEALKAIPDADYANLAIIEGHEGNPDPARWHFLFYDPMAANGLREYVVEEGRVVAEREISQFAGSLQATDVIGFAGMGADSETVAEAAQRLARINGREIATMNFTLRKDEAGNGPLWSATCLDAEGHAFASVIMNGSDARVVSHDGFPLESAPVDSRTAVRGGFHRPTAKIAASDNARLAEVRQYEYLPPIYDGPDDREPPRQEKKTSPHKKPHLPNPIDDVVIPIHRFVRSLLPF